MLYSATVISRAVGDVFSLQEYRPPTEKSCQAARKQYVDRIAGRMPTYKMLSDYAENSDFTTQTGEWWRYDANGVLQCAKNLSEVAAIQCKILVINTVVIMTLESLILFRQITTT